MPDSDLIAEIRHHVRTCAPDQSPKQGVYATGIEGFSALCNYGPTTLEATLYEPVTCLILQGRKETWLGDRHASFGPGDSLIVSHHLPVVSRITEASDQHPYIALVLSVDMTIVRNLYEDVGIAEFDAAQARALASGETDADLLQAMGRLFGLVNQPLEATVMVPLLRREIHFRLLLARHGGMLRQLLLNESAASRIAKAIGRIRQSFRAPISVPDLARTAGMSPSSFHEHFRSLTATTPLQYQKNLRLIEARRLLIAGTRSVANVAFEVGYESPTQFSREYSRKFGASPRKDLAGLGMGR